METAGQNSPTHNDVVSSINVDSLCLRDRTDIVVKYMYAAQKLNCAPEFLDGYDVDELYRKHIHIRTGGKEPGDELRKGSLQDFVNQFDRLIESFKNQRFVKGNEVPFSRSNNLPINGAHRMAAALALGCDIPIVRGDSPGGLWNFNWFINAGFRQQEINLILRSIFFLKPEKFLVSILWSPVEKGWDEIESEINAEAPVVFRRDFEFARDCFNELICDIYSLDWGPQVGNNILRKIALLSPFTSRIRVLFSELDSGRTSAFGTELKCKIRKKYAAMCPLDNFTTIHVSESAVESNHLLNIFCSENNLFHLSRRQRLRPHFVSMLATYVAVLSAYQINPADCCVVGGAAVEVLGLRTADDIDFTTRESIRFTRFNGGVTQLEDGVDLVAYNYPRNFGVRPPLTDEHIIKRPEYHFFSRGVKFVDPSVLLTRRQHQRRDKDLRDLKMLASYLDS